MTDDRRLEQERERAELVEQVASDSAKIKDFPRGNSFNQAVDEASASPWFGFTDGEGPERL